MFAHRPERRCILAIFLLLVSGSVHSATDTLAPATMQPGLASLLASDFRMAYRSPESIGYLLLGAGVAAALSQSVIDDRVQRWHRQRIRSIDSNHLAGTVRDLGDWRISAPVMLGLWAGGSLAGSTPHASLAATWGQRYARALTIGTPALLGLQRLTGGSRPGEAGSRGSGWSSFTDDNGVSGHAFFGALPLLSAASLPRHRSARVALTVASTLPAWSRINDDRHYASQAILGWWLAWIATRSVTSTDTLPRVGLHLQASGATGGPALVYRFR